MTEIKKLSELTEEQLNQSLDVFVEGFYNVFSSITKDKKKMHRIFKHSFDYTRTYACLQDEEVVGFLGLADSQGRALKLNRDVFLEEIGDGFQGKIIFKSVNAAMSKLNVVSPQEVYIDFIATSLTNRSKGIGAQLIAFVRDTLGCKTIELEVFSKNPRAKKFYEREGFKVVSEKRDVMMMLQGFGKRIVMRLEAE